MVENFEEELPSFYDLLDRFSLFATSASSCDTQIGEDGSLSCTCEGCMEWQGFLEGCGSVHKEVKYEVFTREHVSGLAHYLRCRAREYELPVMEVLEVGAGSGRLSFHLNQLLAQFYTGHQGPVVKVTATDSGVRGLNGPSVQKQDALLAIRSAKPHCVIACWMPMKVDWTHQMRATSSVHEYILIGEMDDGICGDPWLTWGYSPPFDSSSDSDSDNGSGNEPDSRIKASSFHPSTHLQDNKFQKLKACRQLRVGEGDCSSVSGPRQERPSRKEPQEGQEMLTLISQLGRCKSTNILGDPHHESSSQILERNSVPPGESSPRKRFRVDSAVMDREVQCGMLEIEKGQQNDRLHKVHRLPTVSKVSQSEPHLCDRLEKARGKSQLTKQVDLVCDRVGQQCEPVDEALYSVKQKSPHEMDGWKRVELKSLGRVQICRTDERWSTCRHSHTVSFRRN